MSSPGVLVAAVVLDIAAVAVEVVDRSSLPGTLAWESVVLLVVGHSSGPARPVGV